MAWPSTVTAGVTPILATQFNDLIASLEAWGGDVSAAGFALSDLAAASFTTTNAAIGWEEFQWIAIAGASQSLDSLALQYNARITSGGADSWQPVLSVGVATGAITISSAVVFTGGVSGLGLATVAYSGAYSDLSGVPTIPAAQVNSDWTASSGVAQILHKPTLATVATSGIYTDLSSLPTLAANTPSVSHQFLTAYNSTTGAFTQAQPAAADVSGLATVATSGAYSDLSGRPTLAANTPSVSHQFFTAYNSTTGAFSKAQPAAADVSGLATVATSGAYTDLSGVPTLPANTPSVAHQFLTAYNSSTGAFTQAQPAAADVSGLAASATTDTTNAANITTGQLAIANGGTGAATAAAALTALGGMSLTASNTISGSNQSTTAGVTYAFRSTNASWDEFRITVFSGGTIANDQFQFAYNSRTTVGGSDSWLAAIYVLQSAAIVTNIKVGVGTGTVRQQLSVGAGLDLFTGTTATTAQPSIRSTGSAGTLNIGAVGTNPLQLQWDAGTGGVIFGNGASGSSGASVSSAGLITCPSLTVSTPANISFGTSGSNWQTWTPTYSCSGSMTISSTATTVAQYVRVGPFIFFHLLFTGTLGGTLSNTVNASLPVAVSGSAINCFVSIATSAAGATSSLGTLSSSNLGFTLNGGGNYPSGAISMSANGFYKCAG